MEQKSHADEPSRKERDYVVVARRYRPQTFEDLIGQEHVSRALAGAIESHRVGHAYLFTGARGVGKTSAARILAKALNCERGPTATPCNSCDVCERIAAGDDVDVLEIDGASNRGIEEMRELRQNVNVRPSRSRYKIYIIDEVHMLTREAFNALLKTLEEPPEHVKFIFCTTEVEKIPITILSRCQRFDFAGIRPASIRDRLKSILQEEGATADDEALHVLARRAAGSMRDSQSLLEQLLGFGGKHISVADVHRMLGTAADEGLVKLVKALAERDSATALASLDRSLGEGVDVGQLLDQLIGSFRDCIVLAVGGSTELLDVSDPEQIATVREIAERLGPETLLAAIQILEQASARLRSSSHGRILAEIALVRICCLERLEVLSELIATLRDGAEAPKKKLTAPPVPEIAASRNAPEPAESIVESEVESAVQAESSATATAFEAVSAADLWRSTTAKLTGLASEYAQQVDSVAFGSHERLIVVFSSRNSAAKGFCERGDQRSKLEAALSEVAGRRMQIECQLRPETAEERTRPVAPPPLPHERLLEKGKHPLIVKARELLHATPVQVEEAS